MRFSFWLALAMPLLSAAAYGQDRPAVVQDKQEKPTRPASAVPQ
jgi:hypothetical protein